MEALFISKDLLKEIRSNTIIISKVHSVFNNACNLEYKDNLITILAKGKIIAPMSITIDDKERYNFKDIKKSSKFIFTEEFILCNDLTFRVDLKMAKVYNPRIQPLRSYIKEAYLFKNIADMRYILFKYGKLEFFYSLLDDIKECIDSNLTSNLNEIYIQNSTNKLIIQNNEKNYLFIRYRVMEFLKAIMSFDICNIEDCAANIIGFGFGLTPSIDDFISGIMISIQYLSDYYNLDIQKIYEFNNRLIKKSINKTTKVSSEMLKHSAKGSIGHDIKELMTTLLSKDNYQKLTFDLKKVLSFGETSGSDIVFGIYIGIAIITDIRYRRNWE